MKSLLPAILFLLILFTFNTKAQKPSLPIDEKTRKPVYTEVVQVAGVSQAELYKRLLNWFKTYFPNPASVIKEQDSTAGKISGQHGLYIFKDIEGQQFKSGQVRYTIEIMVKDGRFKYSIYDIFKLQSPKIYIEEWLDESAADKDANFGYLNQVDKHIKEVIARLKEAMQKPVDEKKGEDW